MISEELKNEVKKIFKDKSLNPNSILNILKKNIKLKKELEIEFNKYPDLYISIGKLVILIIKDIELSKCYVCGKTLNYDTTINGREIKFCSNKCKLSKEGNPFARKEIKNKIKETYIKKYGVDNPAKAQEIKNKIQETCLEKYGVKHIFQDNKIKEKIKNTFKQRYNTNNLYGNKNLREKAIKSKKINVYNKIINKYKGIIEPLFTVDEYNGVEQIYKWKCCKCGNIFEAKYDDGQIHSRCFNCYPRKYIKASSYEKEIIEFLTQYNINIKTTDRNIIRPKELDIVIPNKKVAIEFNGTYWHSNEIKDSNYHLNKTEACEKVGYKLIHIYEYIWKDENKKQILKDKLKAILDIEQEKIYARKCIIKEISNKDKNEFLDKYHIQGKDKSKIKIGLYYNEELVAVMTFGKPRFNKKYEYELIRYATKAGYRVLGGAGKLLKYFEKTYNPKSVITYADRSYSQGNMYRKIGFNEIKSSGPNYVYYKDDEILTRYECQKHKLQNILKNYNPKLTEIENMLYNEYIIIYDSGNLVFEKVYN